MSRPVKRGIDYFPMYVDFFESESVKFISAKCGAVGICIMMKLLCNIYRNGYFVKWGEGYAGMLEWDLHDMVTAEDVEKCVDVALETGVFDNGLYTKFGVLTSKEIQDIYLMAVDGKRQNVIIPEIWLTDVPKNMRATALKEEGEKSEKAKPAKAASAEKKARKPREKTVPPTLEEVTAYFAEKGYRREQAEKAFAYYEAGGWKDQTGNPVKNWKQKMIAVWMKDEAKVPDNAASTGRGIAW